MWIAGDGVEAVAETINDNIQPETKADHLFTSPMQWAEAVVKLPRKLNSNLVPWYIQQRPQRRRLLRGGIAVLALLLLVTIATVVTVEMMVGEHNEIEGATQAEIVRLRGELAALQNKERQEQQERHRLEVFGQLDQPQAPLLFLRRLAAVVPVGVALRTLEVTTQGAAWPFMLQGEAGADPDRGLELVDRMEQGLARPPLVVSFIQRGEQSWQQAVQQGDRHTFAQPLKFTVRGVVK